MLFKNYFPIQHGQGLLCKFYKLAMKAEPSSTVIPMIKVNEVQAIIKLREHDLMVLRQNT